MNRQIVKESKKVLSNNFLGENNMDAKFQSAIGLKFGFFIDNTITTTKASRNVAIVPGHYNTQAVVKNGEIFELKYNSIAEMVKAGVAVDAVLSEGSFFDEAGKNILDMGAANSKYTIRAFLDYIKTNPVNITKITFRGKTTDAYNSQIMFKKTNPFRDQGSTDVDVEEYFSEFQQQDGKVNMTFPDAKPQLSDDLLMVINVPANVRLDMILHLEFPV